MKLLAVGFIGCILCFVSLAMPWWTISFPDTNPSLTLDVSVYLYRTTVTGLPDSFGSLWFGYVTILLVVAGALLCLLGNLGVGKRRPVFVAGGILAVIGLFLFAATLQMNLFGMLGKPVLEDILGIQTNVILFGSGTLSSAYGIKYVSYLTFGFWTALAGAVMMTAASKTKPQTGGQVPVYPPVPQSYSVIRCPYCGTFNPESNVFCGKCSARLREEQTNIY